MESGAMVSVVRKDVVEKFLKEENKTGGFIIGFDKTRVQVLGEMELTVRFGCQVADLRRVKVVENSVYVMILGAEWIEKSNIIIFAVKGQLVAQVRTDIIDSALLTIKTPPLIEQNAANCKSPWKELITGVDGWYSI